MAPFPPADDAFAQRVRDSFARQRAMATFGVELARVAPGEVDLVLPYRDELTQQHGFVHAGVIAAVADSSCGYAAFSLMPADCAVLSVEFKVNLMAPAKGERFVAQGRVVRPGRTITVCEATVLAMDGGKETAVATMLATIMAIRGRAGIES